VLAKFLAHHGYRISVAHDGKAMMQMLEPSRDNLIVLDQMLPGEDGLSLRHLRAVSVIPIIMLTAMGEQTDRVVGLEMGAAVLPGIRGCRGRRRAAWVFAAAVAEPGGSVGIGYPSAGAYGATAFGTAGYLATPATCQ
jgi:CheY-like chemotaxis protein